MRGPICFLSDFGLDDSYVGVVKGAILSVEPAAPVVDLTHTVPPQDIQAGAYLLMTAVGYFPPGTTYLAVVDPGVGTDRPAVAVEAADYYFVGPDNGLLSWALLRLARTDDVEARPEGDRLWFGTGVRGVALDEPRFWRPSPSTTFHGRDVFGPVAAHLAAGLPLEALGRAVPSIRGLPFPSPRIRDGTVHGLVIYVDRFGNLITNIGSGELGAGAKIRIGNRAIVGLAAHFQTNAPLIALIGSSDLLEIAVPNGSAAELLGLGTGAPVEVRPSRLLPGEGPGEGS